jgi:hypothetical protein
MTVRGRDEATSKEKIGPSELGMTIARHERPDATLKDAVRRKKSGWQGEGRQYVGENPDGRVKSGSTSEKIRMAA